MILSTSFVFLSVFNIYSNNELSVSFIQALLDTSVCGTNVQELIVDCAKYKKIQCGSKNSCQQLDETIISIKNKFNWAFKSRTKAVNLQILDF